LNDPDYKPDLTFGSASADHLQYGASDEAEYLLTRKRRTNSSNTKERDTKGIYKKWMNDDVQYLITEKEKQGFTELKTNEEFEQFIQEFWKRRDTTPETTENEFRREYYGRIAYANQNFPVGKNAGWLSDRGRIYITHGKPDEIQKTATGEIWIYKNLPGREEGIKFEFVNAEGKGEFRLRQ